MTTRNRNACVPHGGVEVGEGEGVVGAAGGGEAALDGLRQRVLVGEDGRGEAAGEQPVREPQRAARVAAPAAGFGGGEAEDELLDEILGLVVVHGLFSNSEFTTLSCNQTPTQPSQITRAAEIPSRSRGLGAVPLASSYVPRLQPLQPLFHIPTNIHNHQNQHYKLWLLIEHIINKTE